MPQVYIARILGPEGQVLIQDIAIPSKMPWISLDYIGKIDYTKEYLDTRTISARLERELGPEDGGPLLIYRVSAKEALG